MVAARQQRRALALVPASLESAAREGLRAAGLAVEVEADPVRALARVAEGGWSVVLVSLSVEGVDLGVVGRVVEACGGRGVVVASAAGASLEVVVESERVGVVEVLREPFASEVVAETLERLQVRAGAVVPVPVLEESEGFPRIVGSSPAMAQVFQMVGRVARSPATVLIRGESGTGKELLAKAIHAASDRSASPFVAVNCAAIPEHLLESELFGHERGAFTGAVVRRRGRFERASGGTLFLDEIGDMSLVLQAKILRALEEREIERLGGESRIPVDVRVIAATNRWLPEVIGRGEFREDLYYRLAVVEVELPPLRDRADDFVELALHFAGQFAARYGRAVRFVGDDTLARLRGHNWPGNVRELRNVMDRAVLLARGAVIGSGDLHLESRAWAVTAAMGAEPPEGYPPSSSLAEVEAWHMAKVLRHTGGHMGEAARIMGIHRNTLTRKVKEHEIRVGEPVAAPQE